MELAYRCKNPKRKKLLIVIEPKKHQKLTQKKPLFKIAFLIFLLCVNVSCKVKDTKKVKEGKSVWAAISLNDIKQSKDSLPKKFMAYKLDEEGLRKLVAPDSTRLKAAVDFPMPDGSFVTYSIIEVQVMSPALAAKYPKFKTYEGVDLSNSANRVRIDFNNKNFHAYFMTLNGEYFIAPVDGDEKNYYMVFNKEDSPFPKLPFEEGNR